MERTPIDRLSFRFGTTSLFSLSLLLHNDYDYSINTAIHRKGNRENYVEIGGWQETVWGLKRCGPSLEQIGGVQAGVELDGLWVGQRKEAGVLRNGWQVQGGTGMMGSGEG